jgi:gamma-glutamyltranspeptidase
MQNRGHGFSLRSGSPNLVTPGRRPFHTIIPAFLTRDGKPQMSFGVMGGNMQPQAHLQTIVRMLDYRQPPQAACDAPRWRFNQGLEINVEASMPSQTVRRPHRTRPTTSMSSTTATRDFGSGPVHLAPRRSIDRRVRGGQRFATGRSGGSLSEDRATSVPTLAPIPTRGPV